MQPRSFQDVWVSINLCMSSTSSRVCPMYQGGLKPGSNAELQCVDQESSNTPTQLGAW
jgi:hypothetical protein